MSKRDFALWIGGGFGLGALIALSRNKQDAAKGKKVSMGGNEKHIAMYRLPDGSLKAGRNNAILTTPAMIVSLAAPLWAPRSPGFFAGIGDRETAFAINEEDTDFNADGSIKANTYGVVQSGRKQDSITSESDLGPVVARFVDEMNGNLTKIATAAGFDPAKPPRGAYAYLAWSHNAGLGGVPGKFGPLDSIKKYGMDWDKLKARPDNQKPGYMHDRMIPYGDAVLRYVDLYPSTGVV